MEAPKCSTCQDRGYIKKSCPVCGTHTGTHWYRYCPQGPLEKIPCPDCSEKERHPDRHPDRQTLIHRIATELDKPSVYMGGPSKRSLRQAEVIADMGIAEGKGSIAWHDGYAQGLAEAYAQGADEQTRKIVEALRNSYGGDGARQEIADFIEREFGNQDG